MIDIGLGSGINYLEINSSFNQEEEESVDGLKVIRERADSIKRSFADGLSGRVIVASRQTERVCLAAYVVASFLFESKRGLILSGGSELEVLIRLIKGARPDIKMADFSSDSNADVIFSEILRFKNFKESCLGNDFRFIVVSIDKKKAENEAIVQAALAYFKCRTVVLGDDDEVLSFLNFDKKFDYGIGYENVKPGATVADHPLLSLEYVGEKDPAEITLSSSLRVGWECLICGHNFFTRTQKRSSGTGCPICGKNKARLSRIGETDRHVSIVAFSKKISSEFVKNKDNSDYGKEETLCSSNDTVVWLCGFCGKEYERSAYERCNRDLGCPWCWGKRSGSARKEIAVKRNNLAMNKMACGKFRGAEDGSTPENVNQSSDMICDWECDCGVIFKSKVCDFVDSTMLCHSCRMKKRVGNINRGRVKEKICDMPYADELVEIVNSPTLDKNNASSTSRRMAIWKCSSCQSIFECRIIDRRFNRGWVSMLWIR